MPYEIGDELSIKTVKLPFVYGLMNGLRPKKSGRDVNRNKILGQRRKKRPLTVFLRLPIMHRDASCVSL